MADINTQTKQVLDKKEITNPTKIFSAENQAKEVVKEPTSQFFEWTISYKINNRRDLNTYLHLGDDKLQLITNVKSDNKTFSMLPYSIVYKLYEPLLDDIEEKDNVYIVREILPQLTETVELVH